jgi:hypothetical protein
LERAIVENTGVNAKESREVVNTSSKREQGLGAVARGKRRGRTGQRDGGQDEDPDHSYDRRRNVRFGTAAFVLVAERALGAEFARFPGNCKRSK